MVDTDLIVILDRSGSMVSHKEDHEGGLRSFIAEQRKLAGDVRLTFVRFDTTEPFELVYDRTPLSQVEESKLTLVPRGGTPLIEAVSRTLAHLEPALDAEPKHQTVVMIVTDGQENESAREYTKADLQKRIQSWEAKERVVLYLGAKVDEFAEAAGLGVNRGHTMGYAGHRGTRRMYSAMSANVLNARTMGAKGMSVGVSNTAYVVDDAARAQYKTDDDVIPRPVTPVDLTASDTTALDATEGGGTA